MSIQLGAIYIVWIEGPSNRMVLLIMVVMGLYGLPAE